MACDYVWSIRIEQPRWMDGQASDLKDMCPEYMDNTTLALLILGGAAIKYPFLISTGWIRLSNLIP